MFIIITVCCTLYLCLLANLAKRNMFMTIAITIEIFRIFKHFRLTYLAPVCQYPIRSTDGLPKGVVLILNLLNTDSYES